MGVDAHGLNCLRYAKRFGDFRETVTIARQGMHMKPRRLQKIYGNSIRWNDELFCEKLLTTHFGASLVESIDNSTYEGATYVHDMNKPIPDGFREYDTVLELGTVEHIYNVSQSLDNMIALCKEGGQILHVSPANNFCGHGFWQISPELFFSLYSEANGFKYTEVFVASRGYENVWYKVKKPQPGERVPMLSRTRMYVICRTVLAKKHVSNRMVQQSDYVQTWSDSEGGGKRKQLVGIDKVKARFRKRVLHKYFRYPTGFNPNLIRLRLSKIL